MKSRMILGLITGFAALNIGAGAAAQETSSKGPGAIVFQNSDDAKTEVDPNDPRPLILQSSGALLFMLMNNMPADSFRAELDAYNKKYPAPSDRDIAAAIHKAESDAAAEEGTCAAKLPSKLKIRPSTAAPAVRQYIASKEITNAWIVSHRPKGCGKIPARVYTVAQKMDGSLLPLQMPSGETLINLNIHYDLARLFSGKLPEFYQWKKADCSKGGSSFPTAKLVNKNGDWSKPFYGTHLSGKWREEWTFKGCGGTAVIPIDLEWKGATNTEYLVQFPEATWTPDS